MSYSVNDFSFNIGETEISQQYVNSLKLQVPWGINLTYIYKDSALDSQFLSNNKHLVIENKCLSGNIIFKTQGTGRTIINDLSVNSINGVSYSASLRQDSVNSSHIQDGSILGSDISNGTITETNLSSSLLDRLNTIKSRLDLIDARLNIIDPPS